MAYSSRQQRRMPTTRETAEAEFAGTDGSVDTFHHHTTVTGSTPRADVDKNTTEQQVELACGCYWPTAKVKGSCADCAKLGLRSQVCEKHYVVCECGWSCCQHHSKPTEDPKIRLCLRCHLRARNEAMKASALHTLGRLAGGIFFRPVATPEEEEDVR